MSYYVDYYDDYVAEPRPNRWLIDLTPVYRDDLWSNGGPPLPPLTDNTRTTRPSTTTTKRPPPPAVRTQETIVDRLLRESLEIVEEKRRLEQTLDDVPHTVVESDRDDNTQLSPYVPLTILAFLVWYVWRKQRRT